MVAEGPGPRYFKVLGEGLTSFHGGTGNWAVGEWRSVTGVLRPCENGLHFVKAEQLIAWLGPVICPFEPAPRTKIIEAGDKLVCRKGRIDEPLAAWNERTMRLFAADCAERVLPLFEERYPDDKRPREAISVARRYANGEASLDELQAADRAADSAADRAADSAADRAAYSAAYRAADSAADSAAYSAADSAAYSAAYSAADSAADRAADSAAYSAAYSAERQWQTARLMEVLGITPTVSERTQEMR